MYKSTYYSFFWKFFIINGFLMSLSHADSNQWSEIEPFIQARVSQKNDKMKLQAIDAIQFKNFLENLHQSLPQLELLQSVLPKTTIELLMAINKRGLDADEAEKIAKYLEEVVNDFDFSNKAAFDENTSHIIGREWHEIDYSGENMNWQKQKAKYKPYGIDHFKSLECIKKFIPVESKLPYFKKVYRPKNI